MLKKILPILLSLILFASCTTTQNNETLHNTDEHPGFSDLAWEGTYVGTEACSSCKQIRKSVTLNDDMTYDVKAEYEGANNTDVLNFSGEFEWTIAGGLRLYSEDKKIGIIRYLISNRSLLPIDKAGNPMTDGSTELMKQSK